MNSENQFILDIISQVETKKISVIQAARLFAVSERTVLRWMSSYRAKGVLFLDHGNRKRSPVNKTSIDIIDRAESLMRAKYFDFNMTHALEKLSQDEGIHINRESFRRICHKIGLVKKAHKRRSSVVRRSRQRMAQVGLMLQMDGSPHRWFNNTESCLIGAIDDASSEVPFAEFFESETTLGCLKVLKRIIEKKGLFQVLYVDRAGIYGGPKRVHFSQVKRALMELNIRIVFANSPEGKGRIERLWNTLQDRLIPEMRLKNICSFKAANHFLQNEFLPNEYSSKFQVVPQNLEPAWKVLPTNIDLDEVFCMKFHRLVKRDHTFSWAGKIYQITSVLRYSIHRQKIEIRIYLDESRKVFFAGRELAIREHHLQPKVSTITKMELLLGEKDGIKVRKDGHVPFEKHYYSVNERYIGKYVMVKEQDNTILIYYENALIETHARIVGPLTLAATKPEHLGPWQKTLSVSSIYRRVAAEIGPFCDRIVFAILQRGQGFVDTKSIWAIIDQRKVYGRKALEEACKTAYEIDSADLRGVLSVLSLKYRKLNT